MDVESSIEAFGETEVWVECDLCGRAHGGPGMNRAMVAVGQVNVCVDCLSKWGTSAEGVGPSRPAS